MSTRRTCGIRRLESVEPVEAGPEGDTAGGRLGEGKLVQSLSSHPVCLCHGCSGSYSLVLMTLNDK